jgi:hypothetical protein
MFVLLASSLYFNIKQKKVNQMATKEIKTYSLAEMKDTYFGKIGIKKRDEYELRTNVLGRMIKGPYLNKLIRF